MDTKEDKFWELATNYMANEATEEEINQLFLLLHGHDGYQRIFDELVENWNLSERLTYGEFDPKRAGQHLKSTIKARRAHARKRGMASKLMGACCLALFLLGYYAYYGSQQWETYATAGNNHFRIVLPDSSVVWLNRSSSLSYNFNDPDIRQVKMEGEAFFEVARDSLRPFLVEGPQFTTRVLGTSFNINATSPRSTVSVISGNVAVTTAQEKMLLLDLGEQASYDLLSGDFHKSQVTNIENVLAWKTQSFHFEDLALEEALGHLARVHDIEFTYENEAMKNCRLTASFEKQSLQQILKSICLSLDFEYRIVQGGSGPKKIVLSGKGC